MTRFPSFVALAVGLCLTAPAGAQDADFESRAGPDVMSVVAPLLAEAARDSLPVAALRAKVLEGVAKQVPGERIGQAVAELAADLRTVRGALRERLPAAPLRDPELVAAAMAVRQGVPVDALHEVWQSRPDATALEVPITVLGELVRRGVPVPEAASLMSHVVRTRVPMNVAAQIPGKLDGARGPGEPPGAALGRALRQLNIPNPPGRGRGPGG